MPPKPITVVKLERPVRELFAGPWFYAVNVEGRTVTYGTRGTHTEALSAAEDDLWMARLASLRRTAGV